MTQAPPPPRVKPLPLLAFAVAALTPVPLFALGLWLGGAWLWAGFLYMAGLATVLDRLTPQVAGDAVEGQEFPGSDALLAVVGLSALGLLGLATWVISGGAIAGAADLSRAEKGILFIGLGFWLGQVAHPAAHELIHRGNRWLFRLGQAFYAAVLFGQHASAHRLVHHRHVATDLDPNSAPEGMGFYRFAPRAWWGSFVKGWQAETDLRARGSGPQGLHPYAICIAGSLAALGIGFALGGWAGVLVWAGLGLQVQAQLLVSDYVQHYGLRRRPLGTGKTEPVGPAHSWNSGPWFSSALMLNAPRHSDHHAHPARPYPALRLPPADQAPRLPWPLPMACTVAFFPRLWMRAMRKPLQRWRAGGSAAAEVTDR